MPSQTFLARCLAFTGLLLGPAATATTDVSIPSDRQIQEILQKRIDGLAGKEQGVGIIVGVIEPAGRRVVGAGHFDEMKPFDGDTAFEIGSITKVFTALLLSDMVQRGEVRLDDPVKKYLPANVSLPERNGRQITLVDLATHTAGLPFMPSDLPPFGDSSAKYSPRDIYQFLAHYQIQSDLGTAVEYSNLGYWLLGEALAKRAGTDFETVLRSRVIEPLNLRNTAITPSNLKSRCAVGHNAVLQSAPVFSEVACYGLMQPAGGLSSTANDLLKVLAVAMSDEDSVLSSSMNAMLETRRTAGKNQQALGWTIIKQGDEQLIVHDGGTFGFASSLAWDPKRRIGVVALANQVADVGDITRHLLWPNIPLQTPAATKRTEVHLEPGLLDGHAGKYVVEDEGTFVVKREGDFLTIQAPPEWGLPKLRLRPENPRDFFAAEIALRVTFQKDGAQIYPPHGQGSLFGKKN